MTTFALPSSRLYSCWPHATTPKRLARWMEGTPPPGQPASCHAANDFSVTRVAVSRSNWREAWYCIENDTQSCGHWMGCPAGHPVSGSSSHVLPHVIVRQKACAEGAAPT